MLWHMGGMPCAWWPYWQHGSGLSFYKAEPLIKQALLAPWTACALNATCMMPRGVNARDLGCGRKINAPLPKYGRCHR